MSRSNPNPPVVTCHLLATQVPLEVPARTFSALSCCTNLSCSRSTLFCSQSFPSSFCTGRRERGEDVGDEEDEEDENPTGMQPGHGVGLMGFMALGSVSNLLLPLQGLRGDTGQTGTRSKPQTQGRIYP